MIAHRTAGWAAGSSGGLGKAGAGNSDNFAGWPVGSADWPQISRNPKIGLQSSPGGVARKPSLPPIDLLTTSGRRQAKVTRSSNDSS